MRKINNQEACVHALLLFSLSYFTTVHCFGVAFALALFLSSLMPHSLAHALAYFCYAQCPPPPFLPPTPLSLPLCHQCWYIS